MRSRLLLMLSATLLFAGCAAKPERVQTLCPEVEPMPEWAVADLCRLTGITDPPCGNVSSSKPK